MVVKADINKVIYYNAESNYAVLSLYVRDSEDAKELIYQYLTAIGRMVEPIKGEQYEFTLEETDHPKYGKQYKIVSYTMGLDITDPEDQRTILYRIFPTERVVHMYDALDNPFQTLMDGDAATLLKVRGIGPKNVADILTVFNQKVKYSIVYLELADYQLTDRMVEKLVEAYGSPELVVKAVRDNPYALIYHVDGIGFKKADAIAIKGGEDPKGMHRVEAFIYYYLELQGESGYSWIEPSELAGAIEENLGEIEPFTITEAIHDLDRKLWYNSDHTKIGLKIYFDLENGLAKELLRIRDGQNNFQFKDWEDKVKKLEEEQGFEFTDEQKEGIKACLENQVVLITGPSGSGKTSSVKGMLSVFGNKYSYAQTSLSGKAASRLTEVTGKEGMTIHRLLEAGNQGFMRNEDNQLTEDIIIVDEVSMIDTRLMLALTKAIKTGAKLIMLGDVRQLEPIGIGSTANDLIKSPEIKTIVLTKIHRQAAKSAIITDSISISNGKQVLPKDFVGTETHGELQDLHFDAYSDNSNTFYKIVQHFSTALANGVDINELAVLVPQKTKGDASVYYLNLTLQEMYNPKKDENEELVVQYDRQRTYTIRVGDKVINKRNNYRTCYRYGSEEDVIPIFNGNMGIVKAVDKFNKQIVIDFYGMGEIVVNRDHINNIELAYAITVHSSQGSEFSHVIVGIDFNAYAMLSRQLVYTAITRAKKDCIVCCQTSALRYAIAQNHISDKHTHLVGCLYKLAHPSQEF